MVLLITGRSADTKRPGQRWGGSSEQRPHGGSLILAHQVPEREDRRPRAPAAPGTEPRGHTLRALGRAFCSAPLPGIIASCCGSSGLGGNWLDRRPPGAGSSGPRRSGWRTLEGRTWILPSGRVFGVSVAGTGPEQSLRPVGTSSGASRPPGTGPSPGYPSAPCHQLHGLLMNKPTPPGRASRLPVGPPRAVAVLLWGGTMLNPRRWAPVPSVCPVRCVHRCVGTAAVSAPPPLTPPTRGPRASGCARPSPSSQQAWGWLHPQPLGL